MAIRLEDIKSDALRRQIRESMAAGMQKRVQMLAMKPEPETAPRIGRNPESSLETKFAQLWAIAEGPDLEREAVLIKGRKWRTDFFHRPSMTCIEIDGGQWSNGRHTRGSGYGKDCEKLFRHAIEGYRTFKLVSSMIKPEIIAELIDFCQRRSLPEKRVKRSLKPE